MCFINLAGSFLENPLLTPPPFCLTEHHFLQIDKFIKYGEYTVQWM